MVKVFIDPGHGGNDGGAGRDPYLEKKLTLDVANRLRTYLLDTFNCSVVMSRTTDRTLSLSQRTQVANKERADYLISIHFNAASSASANGYEDYCYTTISDGSRTGRIRSSIHTEVINRVLNKYGIRNRGKKKANFHMVRDSNMPAILVETLFVSGNQDQPKILNHAVIQDFAVAYGEGIGKGLGLSRKQAPTPNNPPSTPTNNPASGTLYRVQVGAYGNRNNANNMMNRLRNSGFPATLQTSGNLFRVQVGAYGNRNNATNMERRLRAAGFSAYIFQN